MQMVNRRDDLDEFFDNLFAQLDGDDDNIVNITISEFGEAIKSEVNNSAKKKGYDTLEDMISHKVSGKTYVRPDVNYSGSEMVDGSRYEYFLGLLNNISYSQSYRGYYMEGHQRMINMFKEKAKFCKENLSLLEDDLRNERRRYSNNKKDVYSRGCIDGLDFIEKSLKKSKLYMMNRIKEELAYRK